MLLSHSWNTILLQPLCDEILVYLVLSTRGYLDKHIQLIPFSCHGHLLIGILQHVSGPDTTSRSTTEGAKLSSIMVSSVVQSLAWWMYTTVFLKRKLIVNPYLSYRKNSLSSLNADVLMEWLIVNTASVQCTEAPTLMP